MAANGTIAAIADKRRHWLNKNFRLLVAKLSTSVLNGGEVLTHGFGGFFAMLAEVTPQINVAAVAGMGVVAATSAAYAQMDYLHAVDNLIDTYRNELSAKLKKPGHAITVKDLDILAKGDARRGIEANSVIAQELRKERAERTIGVLLSAGSSLVTFGIISAAVTALSIAPPLTFAALLVEGIIGVGIYNVVKIPLKKIGHKIFGLDHETTHDRIAKLKIAHEDGKTITREQVLEIFASANPRLDQYIAANYGDNFDKLDMVDRQRAAQDANLAEALGRMADAINHNQMKVGELAFAVEGQISGFDPGRMPEAKKEGMLGAIVSGLRKTIAPASNTPAQPQAESKPRTRAVVEYNNPTPAVPYVEKYNAAKQAGQQQQPPIPQR